MPCWEPWVTTICSGRHVRPRARKIAGQGLAQFGGTTRGLIARRSARQAAGPAPDEPCPHVQRLSLVPRSGEPEIVGKGFASRIPTSVSERSIARKPHSERRESPSPFATSAASPLRQHATDQRRVDDVRPGPHARLHVAFGRELLVGVEHCVA